MSDSYRLGCEGVLYFGDQAMTGRAGDPGSPITFSDIDWTEMDNVMDVDDDFTSNEIDITTRSEAKKGWDATINTTNKGVVKFPARWKPGDAGFEVLRDAWLTKSEVSLLDLDGPFGAAAHEGNQGVVANFSIAFGIKKPVKGVMTVEVTASIASYPDWVEVNSSGILVPVT